MLLGHFVKLSCLHKAKEMLEYVVNNILTLAHITVYIAHQYMAGLGVRKAAANASRTMSEHMKWVGSLKILFSKQT